MHNKLEDFSILSLELNYLLLCLLLFICSRGKPQMESNVSGFILIDIRRWTDCIRGKYKPRMATIKSAEAVIILMNTILSSDKILIN